MAEGDGGYLLVAGLDFGTTFSGYAFSFRNDPEKIICNKSWGESLGFQAYKTPTSILTDGGGEFISMGYDAERKYSEHVEEMEGEAEWHIYRHFKMLLHKSKEVHLKAVVTSEDGTITPAVRIFGHAIGYLRQHLLKAIKAETGTEPESSDVLWVITVPAIWSEPSKQFMREAAKLGGCTAKNEAKNLILALEPEAASLSCRRLNIAGYASKEGITFPPGTEYLVLDCGGGTVDITAHRTLENNSIEEILPASGGPWGGMYVDRQFASLLGEIFDTDFLNKYKSSHPDGWLQLMTSFEHVKKPFNGEDNKTLRVTMPWSFGGFHSEIKKGQTINNSIRAYGNPNVKFANGTLILKDEVAARLFFPVLEEIRLHVDTLLRAPKLGNIKYIFMVGGFSESQLLQNMVKGHFEENGTKVLIPSEAQLAVLKGAVLFGHFPVEIATRIARKTYGFGSHERFNPKIHDFLKTYIDKEDGNRWCRNIFNTLVRQGDSISIGQTMSTISQPPSRTNTRSNTNIYAVDGLPCQPVQYTDSPEVECVGKVVTTLPPCKNKKENEMTKSFTFGSTEIHVHVIHRATGKEFTTSFDFLSDS